MPAVHQNRHPLEKHSSAWISIAKALALAVLTTPSLLVANSNPPAPTVPRATNETAQKIAAELRSLHAKSAAQASFRVKFEQKVFSALRKKTTTSSGELTFTQPKKFRWEISAPSKELYVNNGEWFWKYVENTKHALRMSANASDLEFLDVVFQLDKLPQKYQLEKLTSLTAEDNQTGIKCPSNHTCVSLAPLQKGGQKNIALAINNSNGFVSTVKIEFRNGNRTLINFDSFKPDKFSAEHFEFTPPPGTAVDKR